MFWSSFALLPSSTFPGSLYPTTPLFSLVFVTIPTTMTLPARLRITTLSTWLVTTFVLATLVCSRCTYFTTGAHNPRLCYSGLSKQQYCMITWPVRTSGNNLYFSMHAFINRRMKNSWVCLTARLYWYFLSFRSVRLGCHRLAVEIYFR